METVSITWTATVDELHLLSKLLQQHLRYWELQHRTISGQCDMTGEYQDYRLATHLYNQILQKLC